MNRVLGQLRYPLWGTSVLFLLFVCFVFYGVLFGFITGKIKWSNKQFKGNSQALTIWSFHIIRNGVISPAMWSRWKLIQYAVISTTVGWMASTVSNVFGIYLLYYLDLYWVDSLLSAGAAPCGSMRMVAVHPLFQWGNNNYALNVLPLGIA